MHRIVIEPALGGRQIHAEPDEPLLRTIVQVALEPSQRVHLRLASGRTALGQLAHLLTEGRRLVNQQRVRHSAVQPDESAQHKGSRDQQQRAEHRIERDLGEATRVAEQGCQAAVVRLRQPLAPEPIRHAAEPTTHVSASEKVIVLRMKLISTCSRSRQDWALASRRSFPRKPGPAAGYRVRGSVIPA